ncbi:MAG: Uma2 family endonuclease [Gammaproteobacteria bacterium]|nr:Uma2 family endonuclease [Gammaproteobacteria bacterium]
MPTAPQPLRARKLHGPDATSSAQQFAKRTANAPARALDYRDRDVEAMTPEHWNAEVDCMQSLRSHYAHREDVYVGSELTMYWLEGDNEGWVQPDVFVAFGPSRDTKRTVWKAWEEGKFADFVLEVASRGTHRRDLTEKHALYERLGVTEYWQHDPTGAYLPPRLLGHRLNKAGTYEPVPLDRRPDGTRRGESKVLSLHLCLDSEGCLRLYDPATGKFLLSPREHADASAEKDRAIEQKNRLLAEERRLLAEERRRHAEERHALLAEIEALRRHQPKQ